MIMDKYTKAIMTVIAVALFMIALNPWIAPTKAYAELSSIDLMNIEFHLNEIKSAVAKLSTGKCRNSILC